MKKNSRTLHSPNDAAVLSLTRLKRRVGIGQELLKVRLEPCASLRSRSQCISIAAVEIIARGSRVARPIGLTARLHPDDGIQYLKASV